MVMNYLPGPILAPQDERISTISSVLVPADLALEMKGAESVGNVTDNIHRHVAHRHHPCSQETRYPIVVLLYRCPAPYWVGCLQRNVDDVVVTLIPNGSERCDIKDGKPKTILFNNLCNILLVLLDSSHSLLSFPVSCGPQSIEWYAHAKKRALWAVSSTGRLCENPEFRRF